VLLVILLTAFGFYLLYEAKTLMKNTFHKLDSDEYLIAVFMVYVDAIFIFVDFLSSLGSKEQ